MVLNHVHLQVRDLRGVVRWCEAVLQKRPGFCNDHMATFSFGSFTLIFDAADDDTPATIGFASEDCDRDFGAVIERGAIALEPPTNKDYGVRVAYVKGPGELKFEIEGPVVA